MKEIRENAKQNSWQKKSRKIGYEQGGDGNDGVKIYEDIKRQGFNI